MTALPPADEPTPRVARGQYTARTTDHRRIIVTRYDDGYLIEAERLPEGEGFGVSRRSMFVTAQTLAAIADGFITLETASHYHDPSDGPVYVARSDRGEIDLHKETQPCE